MRNLFIAAFFGLLLVASCKQEKKQDVPKIEAIYPSVIEIVSRDSVISANKPLEVCKKFEIPSTSVYSWKNHLIIYDVLPDSDSICDLLSTDYPGDEIKCYDTPYYIFDRSNCENKETAEEWTHTIMTANLVADTVMQKEYMQYHATQSENWPEIANGFCNADFQQLLMFRNGRQLMLIISIPKGENLDDLNPKTTENNPRVDEWNAIMAKYQEGIEGTQDNETWVILSPIKQ